MTSPMPEMHILKSNEDLDAALQTSYDHPIVIFKHSATCPFSARAQEQVANAKHELDIYALVIQYVPELNTEIVQRLGVEHESPQAIIVKNGEAIWSGWRSKISAESLIDRVGAALEPG